MPLPIVIFGGPSPEHDISITTGLMAAHTVGDVLAVYWDKRGGFHQVEPNLEPVDFADGIPRKAKELTFEPTRGRGFIARKRPLDGDVVVVCCHGGPGEDGTLQGLLDLAGYRYTSPGVVGSALGMDKLAFGAAVASLGLKTLPRVLLEVDSPPSFAGPYIVKPRYGGSSIGIEIVDDVDTALALLRTSPHMTDGAVVEPFVGGARDLQIGIRTHPTVQLSAIEEPARTADGLYSYEQKYLAWGDSGAVQRHLPAAVPDDTANELRAAAKRVAALVGVRGVARVDFLVVDGSVHVNEINTIPGSLGSYLWIDPPVSRHQLLSDMVAEARASTPRTYSTAGADGSALRNAATIASKLG